MNFNNWQETKKFLADWEKQLEICKAEGLSAEKIKALYEFERSQHKRDRSFYEHNEIFPDVHSSCEDGNTNWLDELENTELALAVDSLSTADKNLLTLIVRNRYTHAEIAHEMGVARQQVTKRFARISRKLYFLLN